jgi:hypothetical protein
MSLSVPASVFVQTHLELTELMKSMATDPSSGISYRDFVRVQLKAKGIDPGSFPIPSKSSHKQHFF